MALTLADKATYANDVGTLFNRVKSAMAETAIVILSEDPGADNHNLRLAWAQRTLSAPDEMAKKMIWGVLGDKNITDQLPDAQSAKAADALVNLADDSIRQAVANAVIGFINA